MGASQPRASPGNRHMLSQVALHIHVSNGSDTHSALSPSVEGSRTRTGKLGQVLQWAEYTSALTCRGEKQGELTATANMPLCGSMLHSKGCSGWCLLNALPFSWFVRITLLCMSRHWCWTHNMTCIPIMYRDIEECSAV